MPKPKTVHRCRECGATAARWLGRCPACGEWGTLVEETDAAQSDAAGVNLHPGVVPMPIAEVDPDGAPVRPTGIGELDRVLGGGLVPGSVTLLGGEPGAGKSTLLLQAADALARGAAGPPRTVLYVSAEESPGQVRLRAERLGALAPGVLLACETDLPAVLALVDAHAPDVLVLDSIQTVSSPGASGIAGGVSQVRECAAALVNAAKARGMATVLVGHVTKDGNLGGRASWSTSSTRSATCPATATTP